MDNTTPAADSEGAQSAQASQQPSGQSLQQQSPQQIKEGAANDQYRVLGKKTMWIFVLQRIHSVGVFLLLAIVLLVVGMQPVLSGPAAKGVGQDIVFAGLISLALALASFCIVFLVSKLIYTHYLFALGENSLKIKRGIIEKEEIAIPYRQIQDVDVARDLFFQAMGLSKLSILTAGREDDDEGDGKGNRSDRDENEGILPALDKDLAEWLRSELLTRANVQRVIEEK